MALIRLLGKLGQRFGREYNLEVATPAEALRALCVQLEGFAQFLHDSSDRGIHWRVVTVDPAGLSEEQLQDPLFSDTLIIAPQIVGSGNFGRILLGAALIGAAFLVPGGFLGISAATIGLFGASLVLGGIAGLLTPKQQTPKEREKQDSFLFSDSMETGKQGTPVPVLYGEFLVTSPIVISSGVRTNEIPV